MAKYYNANDGVFGRPKNVKFLDQEQAKVYGVSNINYVTAEELLRLHQQRTGEVLSISDITAPVIYESVDEVVVKEVSEPTPIVPTQNDGGLSGGPNFSEIL